MSLTGKATTDKVLRGRINRLDTLCLSAYAIAVKNGFEGTEAEWLASLQGPPGATGALWVTVEHNGDGTYKASHTHVEIMAAYQSGGVVFGRYGDMLLSLISANEDQCYFACSFMNTAASGWYYEVIISSDDSVTAELMQLGGASGALWVTIKLNSDGTYSADRTYAELLAAHQAQKVVCCQYGQHLYSVTTVGVNFFIFSNISNDGLYRRVTINSNDVVGYAETQLGNATSGLTVTDDGNGNVTIE